MTPVIDWRPITLFLPLCCATLLVSCNDEAEEAPESEAPAEEASSEKPEVEGMVWIPGGSFMMGSYSGQPNEAPVRRVKLDGFYMDETEVTNAEFRKFVEATGYETIAERTPNPEDFPGVPKELLVPGAVVMRDVDGPVDLTNFPAWWEWKAGANWKHPNGPETNIEGKDDYPVVCIAWADANAYAEWAGKRLPTEAEWEYAARGGLEGKRYEWGNDPLPNETNSKPKDWPGNLWQGDLPYNDLGTDGHKGLAPVKSYKPNGYGLYDMTGNVWEFCSDWYAEQYYNTGEADNPQGPPGPDPRAPEAMRVMRGSSWRVHRDHPIMQTQSGPRPVLEFRVAARNHQTPDTGSSDTGFRCVQSAP